MKTCISLIISLLILVVFSCTSKDVQVNAEQNKILIDPNQNDKVSISDLFDKIEITPLETTNNSLLTFLIGEPDKVIRYKSDFYFLDRKQDIILVFSSEGKFLRRIDKKGQGPDEYLSINDFNINRFTNKLEILSPESRCIYVYNIEGDTLFDKVKFPTSFPIVHQFHNLTSDTYIFASYVEGGKVLFYSNNNNKIVEADYHLPKWFSRKTPFTSTSRNPFYIYNDTLCFEQIYNGKVFTLSSVDYKLYPRYVWDFGKYNFDPSILPDNESADYYLDLLKKISIDHVILFQIYQENSRFYFTRFKFNNRYKHLIYNKNNHTYLLFEQFKEGGQCIPQWIEEDSFFTFVSPTFLPQVLNVSSLDEENKQRYNRIRETDNPIIIKYILK